MYILVVIGLLTRDLQNRMAPFTARKSFIPFVAQFMLEIGDDALVRMDGYHCNENCSERIFEESSFLCLVSWDLSNESLR